MECEDCGLDLDDADIEASINGGWITVTVTCINCEKQYAIDIPLESIYSLE